MLAAGTTEEIAVANRKHFAAQLGYEDIALPKLKHGDSVYELEGDYHFATRPEADAIITNRPGRLIGIATADCIAILLFDSEHAAIAAVHSGYRGTAANIVGKAVKRLSDEYGSRPEELRAYMSPAPRQDEYPVGPEVAKLFDKKYLLPLEAEKFGFDNKSAVLDQLLKAGLIQDHIEASQNSSFEPMFHSYRRDGLAAGRHITVIGINNL